MKSNLKIVFKIVLSVMVVVEIVLVILFIVGYSNYCTYESLIRSIKEELGLGKREGEDTSALDQYTNVFCSYGSMGSALKQFGRFIIVLINIANLISLGLSLISSIISIFKESRCALLLLFMAVICPMAIGFFDLLVAFAQSTSLNYSGSFSNNLINSINSSLNSVKNKKKKLIVYSVISFIFSIVSGIIGIILFKQFNKEQVQKQAEQFYQLNQNQNNNNQNFQQNLVYNNNNYNNSNNYNNNVNNGVDVQENLYQPNNS